HENCESLLGEVLHQRILRREIEDVIFHDPSRNDEHRLGSNRGGRGRILDELDQSVAIDHLARRHGDITADLEILGADRLLAAYCALPVLNQVLKAAYQVLSAIADCVLQQLGICQQEIRGREHVEHLARRKFHHVFVLLCDTPYSCRRVMPPLLTKQEFLIYEVVWPLLPILADEPSILG